MTSKVWRTSAEKKRCGHSSRSKTRSESGAYYWYEIIQWIGDIADYAERVGNRIRLLIAS